MIRRVTAGLYEGVATFILLGVVFLYFKFTGKKNDTENKKD